MLRLKLDFSSPLILKTDGSKLPAAERAAVFVGWNKRFFENAVDGTPVKGTVTANMITDCSQAAQRPKVSKRCSEKCNSFTAYPEPEPTAAV